jgi:HAD superfamily hydrolase (TIGR01509 family)
MRRVHTAVSRDIRVIIFDLGKVIVDFSHLTVCKRLAGHCCLTPDEIYKQLFESKLEARFDEGRITPEQFYAAVTRRLGCNLDIISLKKIWTAIFTINPGISALLRSLKKKYRLLCLSNTNVWHFEYCRKRFTVLSGFDAFILSFRVGARKPRRRIFREALRAAGTPPHQCVYIDDVPEYARAAQALGMHGIHFTSVEQLKHALKQYLTD